MQSLIATQKKYMDPREQIKQKIDLIPLIQEYIPLKKAGRNFRALCPFHGEKSPSFVVSPERQIWHCFGCQKGGDCFTFLMEYEHMDFVEALRLLAKRVGVQLTSFRPSKTEEEKDKLYAINHLASEFYHYLLTKHAVGKQARAYLENRGINEKTIKTYKLGYAPAKWDSLFSYLTKKKGFKAQELVEAGLISSGRAGTYFDRFRSRLMFTLRDHRGNVVGFAGRVLDPQAKEAKYINTAETKLYHKGELLYGLDVTKDTIKKENSVVVVEGEFDMLQSFQIGVANVVALKGTAMTEMQVKLIKRFTNTIILALDFDVAGDMAARRGIEIADREGFNIKVIEAAGGKDPDEIIRTNPNTWKIAVKEAKSVYDFLIDAALTRYTNSSAEGKRAIADEVLPMIGSITNEIVKSHFVKKLSTSLGTPEEAIMRQMEQLQRQKQVPNLAPRVAHAPQTRTRQEVLEEYLLAFFLQKGTKALVSTITEDYDTLVFQEGSYQKIYTKLLAYFEKEPAFAISTFITEVPYELIPTIDRLYLMELPENEKNREEEIRRIVVELRLLSVKQKLTRLTKDMVQENEEKDMNALQKEFAVLTNELSKLMKTAPH